MAETKNDKAWNSLFEKHNILDKIKHDGSFVIKSSEINVFREARLMTKFDHKSQLPKIFEKNSLSLLPISRRSYVISNIKTFKKFSKQNVQTIALDSPKHIESIDLMNITSESVALNCAFISNIISEFTEERNLFPTVNGRMGTSKFNFKIDTIQSCLEIEVENAQIEIDAGYEGENSLCLIEAKNSISDDFIVRQLYYPFRVWQKKVRKKVRPIFLTYTNGVFHLREYEFADVNHYNSLKIVKEQKFVLQDPDSAKITNSSIQNILEKSEIKAEPKIPFPQANSFERIINLCEILFEKGSLTREEVTANYDFDIRQTNYYTDACRYLGLIEKEKRNSQITYHLTLCGNSLFECSITQRKLKFIETILSHLAFWDVLVLFYKQKSIPSKVEIVSIMKTSRLFNINSEKTYHRRASTILRWIVWILEQIED